MRQGFLRGFLTEQEHEDMLKRLVNLSEHPRDMSDHERKCITRIYKGRSKRPFTEAERRVVDDIHMRKVKSVK